MRVVSRDEIQRFGGLTLREILERVAGLSLTSAFYTDRSIIAVRGDQTKENGGHVLFLINGRPTREVQEGGAVSDLMEAFPIAILERIEVIEGPGSVLYGSNAFSGVINLITRKADGKELSLTGFGDQNGPRGGSGQALLKRGDLEFTGAFQFHESPDWQVDYHTPLSVLVGPSPGFPVPAEQTIAIPDRSTGAYLGVKYKGLSFMSSLTEWTSAYFADTALGVARWRRGFADLGYQLKAGKRWDMNFNMTYTRFGLDAPGAAGISRNSNDVVLEWSNAVRATSRDQITFGALYNYIQGRELSLITSPGFVTADGSRPGGALYAQIEHRLSDTVNLIGGFQFDKTGSVPFAALPRGGLTWRPTNRWSVKALYGEAFRAPSLDETLLQNPYLVGNPNLRPERVATVDVGIRYQTNRLSTGINFFHSRQTDSIVSTFSVFPGTYENLGHVTFQGLEWEGKAYLSQALFLSGSLLLQTQRVDPNNSPTSPVSAKAGVSYASVQGWTASVFEIYQGHISGYSNALNPKPAAAFLLTAHAKFGLARYFGPAARNLALFAHGDNLLNTPTWLPQWGANTGDTIPVLRGRTVYLGLEVSLKKD
jgi:outer membrane receptor for ferrienterochelin and colicins